jgi:hypothetical protein
MQIHSEIVSMHFSALVTRALLTADRLFWLLHLLPPAKRFEFQVSSFGQAQITHSSDRRSSKEIHCFERLCRNLKLET